jgi:hypothetical protein
MHSQRGCRTINDGCEIPTSVANTMGSATAATSAWRIFSKVFRRSVRTLSFLELVYTRAWSVSSGPRILSYRAITRFGLAKACRRKFVRYWRSEMCCCLSHVITIFIAPMNGPPSKVVELTVIVESGMRARASWTRNIYWETRHWSRGNFRELSSCRSVGFRNVVVVAIFSGRHDHTKTPDEKLNHTHLAHITGHTLPNIRDSPVSKPLHHRLPNRLDPFTFNRHTLQSVISAFET